MASNEQKNKDRIWYRLDNAAILYPSIQSDRITTMFRLSATLTEPVEPSILQSALIKIIERFPIIG